MSQESVATPPSALRSRTMAAVKGKNTKPEIRVRRALHAAGFRFRLHRKDLPGHPDIVLPRYRIAVMVNGCFWHGHDCRRGSRIPASNASYWIPKIERNRRRDQLANKLLVERGWTVVTIWECELAESTERLIVSLRELRDHY